MGAATEGEDLGLAWDSGVGAFVYSSSCHHFALRGELKSKCICRLVLSAMMTSLVRSSGHKAL